MPYIYLGPQDKIMSFALVHHNSHCANFSFHIPFTLSHCLRNPLERVNMTRVALTILSRIAFVNFDTLYIFLATHNKEVLNKYIATTRHNIAMLLQQPN